MQTIIDWLKNIGEMFSSVFDFVIGIVEDLAYVAGLLVDFVTQIPDYFSWLPAEVLAVIVTIFAIVVIYKLLGREG